MSTRRLHPSEIINEILIDGAKLSVAEAAKSLGVNRTTLSRLLNGHSGISPDMALRLSELLPNTSVTFWLNIQRDYDVWIAEKYGVSKRVSKRYQRGIKRVSKRYQSK